MKAKANKTGRNEQAEHYTKMLRSTMETAAWRALSPTSQALYPWLKLEWRGPDANNNGRLRLSLKQAAARLGVRPDTASRAFHDLQAKGFVVVLEAARLGTDGAARAAAYELTELAMPGTDKPVGRKLYLQWSEGRDFPIAKAASNNPDGRNGNRIPTLKSGWGNTKTV